MSEGHQGAQAEGHEKTPAEPGIPELLVKGLGNIFFSQLPKALIGIPANDAPGGGGDHATPAEDHAHDAGGNDDHVGGHANDNQAGHGEGHAAHAKAVGDQHGGHGTPTNDNHAEKKEAHGHGGEEKAHANDNHEKPAEKKAESGH